MVRNIRHAHLLKNELLQEIVCLLPPHSVGVVLMTEISGRRE